MSKPFTPTYIDKQQMRLELDLPIDPVWDAIGDTATPVALFVGGADLVTVTFRYTTGAAMLVPGGFNFKILASPQNPPVDWYQILMDDPDAIVAGADVEDWIQREQVEYYATSLDPEAVVYGPFHLHAGAEWIFVSCQENNIKNNVPGTLRVDIDLDWEDDEE
jgi:hypothetical protein